NSQSGRLGLTAGHPRTKPDSLETVFGRVLTPQFQDRCLACHGAPSRMPNGEPGISCEVCHGPGQPHLEAVAQGGLQDLGIRNPANGSSDQVVEFCGQCHSSDHRTLFDPRPQDLLISNQAFSLRQSECFIQSGGRLDCIDCHDPHRNARHNDPVYVETCKSCHASGIQAAPCPVDAQGGCIQCHMPSHREGDMVDHWIRVVPATGSAQKPPSEWVKSRVEPRRLFLRILVVQSAAEAEQIGRQMEQGGSFQELARKHSRHPSAPMGGFLGGMQVERMNADFAKAAKALAPGQLSDPFRLGRDFVLLYRMPRGFRSLAIELEKEASALSRKGDLRGALAGYQEALRNYPHFLRALKGMGIALRKAKQFDASIQVLERASQLYPRDADALYQLGLSHGLSGRTLPEITLQRRAAHLNPELVPPRMRLGVLYFQQGRLREAAQFFEEALQLKPLLGAAYYNLGNTRMRQGRKEEAEHALAIAQKLTAKFSESSGRPRD
ncbi:MAG: tetratricopeptide repeat protein, partial [Acidobacteriota bacterium]